MKHPAFVLIAAFLVGTALSACGKQSNEAETADTQTDTPTANESVANDSGTTTYYGSPDEQAKN
jgi:hypothetical protein